MTTSKAALRVLRAPQVAERTGLSIPSLYRLMAEGGFPRSIPLSHQARGWIEHEVDAWLQERVAARDAERSRRTGAVARAT